MSWLVLLYGSSPTCCVVPHWSVTVVHMLDRKATENKHPIIIFPATIQRLCLVLTNPTDGAGVRGTCVRLGMRFYEVSIEHGWWDVLIQPLPFDS